MSECVPMATPPSHKSEPPGNPARFNLLGAVSAENVELEVADVVLDRHQLQLAQPDGLRQRVEVVGFCQPGCEIARLVLPRFSQRNPLQFA